MGGVATVWRGVWAGWRVTTCRGKERGATCCVRVREECAGGRGGVWGGEVEARPASTWTRSSRRSHPHSQSPSGLPRTADFSCGTLVALTSQRRARALALQARGGRTFPPETRAGGGRACYWRVCDGAVAVRECWAYWLTGLGLRSSCTCRECLAPGFSLDGVVE